MIGVSDPVRVVDWSPDWPAEFACYARRIHDALGSLPVAIEHVGSTAVAGLAAKPIIDIDVVLRHDADLAEAVRRLDRIGYRHEGDIGIPGRHAFAWPQGQQRHHVYIVTVGGDAHTRHLLFREYLCAHPDAAQEYAALKRRLSSAHATDRAAYTEGKTEFIERILETAAAVAGQS
jgi:GrpB-like predicted nucleotidyltransferase (UPF0157 family)